MAGDMGGIVLIRRVCVMNVKARLIASAAIAALVTIGPLLRAQSPPAGSQESTQTSNDSTLRVMLLGTRSGPAIDPQRSGRTTPFEVWGPVGTEAMMQNLHSKEYEGSCPRSERHEAPANRV